jgi:hypothetical protein
MQGTMNQKPRRVRRPAPVPSHHLPLVVHQHHVARLQQPKVPPQRVRPESMRILWIAHADVAGHALDVALAREDAERTGHVCENPCAMCGEGREVGDPRKTDTLGDGLEGGLWLGRVVFGLGDGLFGLWRGEDIGGDCGGCHCVGDVLCSVEQRSSMRAQGVVGSAGHYV